MSTDNINDQPALPRAEYSSVPSRNMYQQHRSAQQEYPTARGPAHGRPWPSDREAAAAAASADHSRATRVVHNSSAKRSYGANAFGQISETSHRHVQHDHRKTSAKQRQPEIGGPAFGAHPGATEAQREALVIWERVKRLARVWCCTVAGSVFVVVELLLTCGCTRVCSGGSAMFGELRKVEQALGYSLMPQVSPSQCLWFTVTHRLRRFTLALRKFQRSAHESNGEPSSNYS